VTLRIVKHFINFVSTELSPVYYKTNISHLMK